MLTRVIKCRSWRLLMIPLFVVGAVAPAWAQNTFPASGNVGIGTTSPSAPLHVFGSDSTPAIFGSLSHTRVRITTPDASHNPKLELNRGGTNLWEIGVDDDFGSGGLYVFGGDAVRFGIMANGNVGIGTTSPGAPLHVFGSDSTPAIFGSLSHTRVRITTPDASHNPKLELNRGGTNLWEIGVDDDFGSGGLYVFGGNAVRFGIMANGNVGIGTTNPSAMLHVAGNVQVDGNIAAKYQDVAEWVKSAEDLPGATVVIIDPREPNLVTISNNAYDTRVAGVVSLKPGLLLGEGGEHKTKVAHSGRAKLKVDSGYGAVAIGDLLVTSPTPGYAMRSQPVDVGGVTIHRPGTLIGKALEPLQEGRGEILVLLMLQ